MPKNLNCLKKGTFSGCTSLENISIPTKCKDIGNKCFWFCVRLKNVNFINPNIDDEIIGKDCKLVSIGEKSFEACSDLKNISIPPFCVKLGNKCFRSCKKLSKVDFFNDNEPTKLNLIDTATFDGCSSLKNAIIPASCQNIGDRVFKNCDNLLSVEFLGDDIQIGSECFKSCKNLVLVSIPNANKCALKHNFCELPNLMLLVKAEAKVTRP